MLFVVTALAVKTTAEAVTENMTTPEFRDDTLKWLAQSNSSYGSAILVRLALSQKTWLNRIQYALGWV